MRDLVIIYGLSNEGIRTAEYLSDSGAEVVMAVPVETPAVGKLRKRGVRIELVDTNDHDVLHTLDIATARALILPSVDELGNLQAALHAVEINPDIRVVIRLFNLNLAKKLEESVRNFRVISVSAVASSTFATAALLNKPLLSFEINNDIMNCHEVSGDSLAGRTVRDLEQDGMVVIALNGDIFPDASAPVRSGDRLTVFSAFVTARSVSPLAASGQARAGKQESRKIKRNLADFVRNIDRVLLSTLLVMFAVVISCVVYFKIIEHESFTNAAYFVIVMLTTGGFVERALNDPGVLPKVVGIVILLSGLGIVAVILGIVTDAVMRKRLDLLMGRRRMNYSGHIVQCGIGDVGIRVLEDLVRLNERVVVIEKNPDGKFISAVREKGIPLIISDASLEETLEDANVRQAKAIICATDDDMRNLEIGLNARAMRRDIRVVLRVFDKGFAEKMARHFNIHYALSGARVAAPVFAAAARDTGEINMVLAGGKPLWIRERSATTEDEFSNVVGDPRSKVLALVTPGGIVSVGPGKAAFQAGMRVFTISR